MGKTVAEQVREIIVDQLGVDEARVVDGAQFDSDLAADLLDVIELTMAYEERWGIVIPDEDAEKYCGEQSTVGKAIACVERHVAAKERATA